MLPSSLSVAGAQSRTARGIDYQGTVRVKDRLDGLVPGGPLQPAKRSSRPSQPSQRIARSSTVVRRHRAILEQRRSEGRLRFAVRGGGALRSHGAAAELAVADADRQGDQGRQLVGAATSRGYSVYFRQMLSLCAIRSRARRTGHGGHRHLGSPGKRQKELRATVAWVPYKPDRSRGDLHALQGQGYAPESGGSGRQ
jgi:hypothetical protein